MNNAINDSIIIVGPVGAGKSLMSKELGIKTGMPVISTDLMSHCPHSIAEIEAEKNQIINEITDLNNQLQTCEDMEMRRHLESKLWSKKNDVWVCDRQIQMRKILPNVRNFKDMGFIGKLSDYVRENFGPVAWHFYRKQFENQLLKDIITQLDTPAIIDMGGGMAISLDEEYAKISSNLKQHNPELYEEFNQYINMQNVGFDIIQEQLSKCPNVVELILPENFKTTMSKAGGNEALNNKFIQSGQYSQVANIHIPVDGLIKDNSYNPKILNKMVNQIETNLEHIM